MTTTIPTVRYVFRCVNGHSWTRDYLFSPAMTQWGALTVKPLAHRIVDGKTVYPGSVTERGCPTCSGYADHLSPVRAKVSDTPCGPSCQEAVGPECRCSCQGTNHGIALLRQEVEKGQGILAGRFVLPRPGLDTESTEWGRLK